MVKKEMSWVEIIVGLLSSIFLLVALLFVYTWFFSVLWNLVVPEVLGGKAINYVQSAAIVVGGKMIFSPLLKISHAAH